MLLMREIKTRYRQTALGLAWVILQPLIPAVIFAVIFGAFARLPSGGTPYFLFALSGMVVFGLFSTSVSRGGTAFLRDGQLVSRVYFPRVLLPLATGTAALVDFAVSLAVLLALALASGTVPPVAIVAMPLVALSMLGLGLAVGLAVAALSAHFRDFAIAVPFALQVALYASPVVYSAELIPAELRTLYAMNPLVGLTEAFRATVVGSPMPPALDLALALGVGTVVVVVCIGIFQRAARDLADVL